MSPLEWAKRESALLARHPWEFATCAALAAGLSFGVADYHYIGRIESLKEALQIRGPAPPQASLSGRPFVTGWQATPSGFAVGVDTYDIQDRTNDYNLVLVASVPFANVDQMTDTHIDVSVPYTISGGKFRMAVAQKNLWLPDGMQVAVHLYVVQIPKIANLPELKMLANISKMGGSVLGGGIIGVTAEHQSVQKP